MKMTIELTRTLPKERGDWNSTRRDESGHYHRSSDTQRRLQNILNLYSKDGKSRRNRFSAKTAEWDSILKKEIKKDDQSQD